MTTSKVRLLLTASGPAEALAQAVEGAVGEAAGRPGVTLAFGLRSPGDPIEGTWHGEALGPAPDGFEVLAEASGETLDFDALAHALAPVLEAAAGRFDGARSTLLAGRHHLLAPDGGPYMMVFALRRPAAMTREAFFDYWANRHGPLILSRFRGRGSYYQFHGDDTATAALARRFGIGVDDYDGHAGGWLPDPAVLATSMRRDNARTALEDERQFIDHDRSMLMIYAVGTPAS